MTGEYLKPQQYLKNLIKTLIIDKKTLGPFELVSDNYRLTSVDEGIYEFCPVDKNSDSAYVYSCGIHGNETAPIEIINDMISDIINGELILKNPILFIFGHIDAMIAEARFIDDNLNRMFSGSYKNYPDNKIEAPRANVIEKSISSFFSKYKNLQRVHYDLHTAIRSSKYRRFAVYPCLEPGRSYCEKHLRLFSAMGIEAVLLMHKFSPTLSYFSSSTHGADSFTLELGKVEKFGENNRDDFREAEVVLRSLLNGSEFKMPTSLPRLCQVKKELVRHHEDYQFFIADDTANFTSYKKGEVLASDLEETYKVEEDGEMIAFPNGKVKVGQRSGLILKEVELEDIDLK